MSTILQVNLGTCNVHIEAIYRLPTLHHTNLRSQTRFGTSHIFNSTLSHPSESIQKVFVQLRSDRTISLGSARLHLLAKVHEVTTLDLAD